MNDKNIIYSNPQIGKSFVYRLNNNMKDLNKKVDDLNEKYNDIIWYYEWNQRIKKATINHWLN